MKQNGQNGRNATNFTIIINTHRRKLPFIQGPPVHNTHNYMYPNPRPQIVPPNEPTPWSQNQKLMGISRAASLRFDLKVRKAHFVLEVEGGACKLDNQGFASVGILLRSWMDQWKCSIGWDGFIIHVQARWRPFSPPVEPFCSSSADVPWPMGGWLT